MLRQKCKWDDGIVLVENLLVSNIGTKIIPVLILRQKLVFNGEPGVISLEIG